MVSVGIIVIVLVVNLVLVLSGCHKTFVITCGSLNDIREVSSYERSKWTELVICPGGNCASFDYPLNGASLQFSHLDLDLSNVVILRIIGHLLEIEPTAFFNLRGNLRHLTLYKNNINHLKLNTFRSFEKLVKLGLEDNNIEDLEEGTFADSIIDIVDLSGNKLKSLKANVFQYCKILQLLVKNNFLYSVSSHSLPVSLKVLSLDGNKNLDRLPSMSHLKNLTIVTLRGNSFTQIPDFSNQKLLRNLDLSFNRIQVVTGELDNLDKLESLDLSGNRLETFPPSFLQSTRPYIHLLLADNLLRNINLHQISRHSKVYVTLFGNPWNCECWFKMERRVQVDCTKIQRSNCDHNLTSNSKGPFCVSGESKACSDVPANSTLVEKFKSLVTYDDCDLFNDFQFSPDCDFHYDNPLTDTDLINY